MLPRLTTTYADHFIRFRCKVRGGKDFTVGRGGHTPRGGGHTPRGGGGDPLRHKITKCKTENGNNFSHTVSYRSNQKL